jgi:hypothetical protein
MTWPAAPAQVRGVPAPDLPPAPSRKEHTAVGTTLFASIPLPLGRAALWRVLTFAAVSLLQTSAFADPPVPTETKCTVGGFCYCVTTSLEEAIARRVVDIRATVRAQRQQGKAIGYMSIPLSSVNGAYFGVNARVANEVKSFVEQSFGIRSSWLLNPAAAEVSLPRGATGADYMLMWTQVFEGDSGAGEDFDFVYFVGPSAFARHFGLTGRGDMDALDAAYDDLLKSDPGLARVARKSFREYYALRAAVSFSLGSHDEWDIARQINARRRDNPSYGIPGQLGVFFDGVALSPAQMETPIAYGNVGACTAK